MSDISEFVVFWLSIKPYYWVISSGKNNNLCDCIFINDEIIIKIQPPHSITLIAYKSLTISTIPLLFDECQTKTLLDTKIWLKYFKFQSSLIHFPLLVSHFFKDKQPPIEPLLQNRSAWTNPWKLLANADYLKFSRLFVPLLPREERLSFWPPLQDCRPAPLTSTTMRKRD